MSASTASTPSRVHPLADPSPNHLDLCSPSCVRINKDLVDMYAKMTGQTRERIIADLDRDTFMSAQQALEYGLVDKVVESVNEGSAPRETYLGGIG